MNLMDGLMGLVKAATLLRGDARGAYLLNEMQNENAERAREKRLRDQIYGPDESHGITWNGPRQLPTGKVSGMLEQQGPVMPGHGALPSIPKEIFSPELKAAGIAERKQQLEALPAYQKLAEAQLFAPPKPPIELAKGAQLRDPVTHALIASNEDAPAPTNLAKLQAEMDAMAPNDPRRPSWQAAIKREAEGEAKSPEKIEPDWRIMTDPEKVAAGIPVSASVKTNGKDFQVMVQPKQDAPTESQQKAGYLAGRVADALTSTAEILKKDPAASTNWLLNTAGDNRVVGPIVKKFTNPNAQIFKNNMTDAIDAIITLGTGAAYTGEQLIAARNAYLPQPGEPKEVTDDKRRKLKDTYLRAKAAARAAGADLPDITALDAVLGGAAPSPDESLLDGLPPGAVKQPDGSYKDPVTGETYVWQE